MVLQHGPLMVERDWGMTEAASLASRLFDAPIVMAGHAPPERSVGVIGEPLREVRDWEGRPLYRGPRILPDSQVAHIEIEGVLVPKGKWTGALCDATSYEGLHVQVTDCRRDAGIKGVILEVDSFGGAAG